MHSKEIRIDDYDIQILMEMIFAGDTTISKIAKKLFNIDSWELLRKKSMFVDYRLKKMKKYGVIDYVENNGIKYYKIKPENCMIGKGTVRLKVGDEIFEFDIGNTLMIKLMNKTWVCIQL